MTADRVRRATAAGRAYLDLRQLATQDGRATDEYLRLYALEGFLARLAESRYRDSLVVKGGALLAAYAERRPTADIDLAGRSVSNDSRSVLGLVIAVAEHTPEHADGLTYDTSHARATSIRDGDQYSGVRVSLGAELATARMAFHVDVNVGDPIWPQPQVVSVPRLLGGHIQLLGYSLPMVLAEKLVTALERGAANTRWRDFADIYLLTSRHQFDSSDIRSAVAVVAAHRAVELRRLRDELAGYPEAGQARWVAWRQRQRLEDRLPLSFTEVVGQVIAFADGCFETEMNRGSWYPAAVRWQSG